MFKLFRSNLVEYLPDGLISPCHRNPTVQPRDSWIPGKHQSDLHITISCLKTGDRKRLLSYSLSDETHRHVAVSNYQSVRHSSNFVFDSLIQLPKLPRGAACTHGRVQYFLFKHAIHYTKGNKHHFWFFGLPSFSNTWIMSFSSQQICFILYSLKS